MPVLERLGAGELRRLARRPRALRDRLRLRADRRAAGRARRPTSSLARGGARSCSRRFGHEVDGARRASDARRGRTRRPTSAASGTRTGAGILDPGKLARGPARRGARAPACACTSTRAVHDARDDGTGVRVHAPPAAACARAGCCSPPAPIPPLLRAIRRYVAPVYDYALVTEPLEPAQRAAIGWQRPPGHRRRRQPVPLLPADRRRPHPVRRLRRRLPLRRPGRPAPRRARRDASRRSPSTSSHVPAARGRALHATAGAARSTPAAASRSSSARRTAAASPTPPATPASASRPTRFGGRVGARPARRPRDRGHAPALRAPPSRSRSRPSRCAGR